MAEKVTEKKKKLTPVEAAKLEAEAAIKADNEARKKIEAKAALARERDKQEENRARKQSRYNISMRDVSFLILFVLVFVTVSYLFSLL